MKAEKSSRQAQPAINRSQKIRQENNKQKQQKVIKIFP